MMGKLTDMLHQFIGGRVGGWDRRRATATAVTLDTDDFDPDTGALRAEPFLALLGIELGRTPGALLMIEVTGQFEPLAVLSQQDRAETLRLAVQAIRQAVRGDDIIGAVDGDRFAVLLRGAEQSLAGGIAQRICDSVDNTMFITSNTGLATINVAVGGAVFEADTQRDPYATALFMLDAACRGNEGRIAVG